VMSSTDELSPFPRTPILRSIDRRRVEAPRNYHVEFVPGLDHSMHAAKGRALAAASIDRFVHDLSVMVTPESTSDS
jgi:hypothetical protein